MSDVGKVLQDSECLDHAVHLFKTEGIENRSEYEVKKESNLRRL